MKRRSVLKALSLTGIVGSLPFPVIAQSLNTCDPTTSDILGPFYIPNQPFTAQLAPAGAPGTPLLITGTVYASDCITPLENALVDVWQANDGGQYENNNYRGRIHTDASGNYSFSSILPGKYLNGSQYRPRHLHYKVSYPSGQNELTTQVYFEGDTSIPIDPWASDPAAADRIIPLSTDGSGNMHGVMDVILSVSTGIQDLEKSQNANSKGMILGGRPNPFTKELTIQYYLPGHASTCLVVYDILGNIIISHEEDTAPGKHKFHWNGLNDKGIAAPRGIFIVKLFTDGVAVDAKRFLKV